MLVALLGLGAVVFDYGAAVTQRRNMQNVADAAALAGAQELDGTSAAETAATAKAIEYINKNVSDLAGSPEITFNGAHTEITVKVAKTSPSFFLGTFGLGDNDIGAKATARIAAPLYGGPGVVPMAVAEGRITYGQTITIKTTGGNGNNGNYGWIDLGTGANDICNFIRGGSTTSVTDPQPSETGNVSKIKNSDCLPRRMEAAKANNCYTYADTVITVDGVPTVNPRCDPLGAAAKGTDPDYPDTQPTAIVIFPVVVTFPCDHGHCDLDVVGTGDELRTFAYFLLDRTTYERIGTVGPTCNGGGQCEITGQFIQNHLAPVSTAYDEPTGDYTPGALVKIVQLVD